MFELRIHSVYFSSRIMKNFIISRSIYNILYLFVSCDFLFLHNNITNSFIMLDDFSQRNITSVFQLNFEKSRMVPKINHMTSIISHINLNNEKENLFYFK